MSTHRGNEPAAARGLRRWLRAMQSDARHVSAFGKAWRLIVMVPVFGMYLIIARWCLRTRRPIDVVSPIEYGPTLRCTPPDLVMMYAHVFSIWEPDISRFVASRLRPGDTFVDIGANVGYYALLASSIVGDQGTVVAIEASPRIFERLNENVQRNELVDVARTVNVAAASKAGELTVHLGPKHNLGLTTTAARSGFAAEATVEAVPLDAILRDDELRNARLVKIDVEGGEDDVLAGLMDFVRSARDDVEILVEMTPRWWASDAKHPADVLQPLLDMGFHTYRLANNYWPWRYLWAHDVQRPKRVRSGLDRPIRRLDLVLSRVDAEEL